MTILVSACLLGVPCRYDGQSKAHPLARALCEKHHAVPVCGEIFGGLPTPRPPAEIQGDRVVTRDGRDVTEAYRRGAEAAAQLARLTGAQAAVLKERSPSCGSGAVYDGTFSGVLTEGWGITAALLRQQGLPAAVWSCIDSTCHQPDEHSSITATLKDAQVFAHVLMQR